METRADEKKIASAFRLRRARSRADRAAGGSLLALVAPLTACGLNKVYAPADPGI